MDAFSALCRTSNHAPKEAMRPFDSKRAGTVLSDGGALLLIESQSHYLSRKHKVPVLAEIKGVG